MLLLCWNRQSILLLSLHEFQVLWVRVATLLLCLIAVRDAWLISERFAFTTPYDIPLIMKFICSMFRVLCLYPRTRSCRFRSLRWCVSASFGHVGLNKVSKAQKNILSVPIYTKDTTTFSGPECQAFHKQTFYHRKSCNGCNALILLNFYQTLFRNVEKQRKERLRVSWERNERGSFSVNVFRVI